MDGTEEEPARPLEPLVGAHEALAWGCFALSAAEWNALDEDTQAAILEERQRWTGLLADLVAARVLAALTPPAKRRTAGPLRRAELIARGIIA